MTLNPINPCTYPNWNDLLRTHPDATFFHTSNWAKVLCDSYRYQPVYFTSINNDKLSALIPVMEINSLFTGKRGASLPFTDQCEPLLNRSNRFHPFLEKIYQHGKKAGWKSVEFRGGQSHMGDNISYASYFIHTLNLSKDHQEIFSNFRDSTKRNIKKAAKSGVEIDIGTSLESLKAFYWLNCITRKRHGLPPQPFSFFKSLYQHVFSKKKGIVVLASFQEKAIAGGIYFHFNDKAIYKYGASDPAWQRFRPNNRVMWEAIKYYNKKGFMTLNLGRTETDNTGLLQFKRGWGGAEKIISYFRYDLKKNTYVKAPNSADSFHRLFKSLPLPILRLTGILLYRHVG